VAAIAIAVLSVSDTALARATSAGRADNPTISESLRLRGTHDFSLEVELQNHQALWVRAYAPDTEFTITTYRLHAPQDPDSGDIKASLGKLGSIDAHFVPQTVREVKPLEPICKGETEREERGYWIGSVEFRGERGYTEARAGHGSATISVAPPPTCGHPHKGQAPDQSPPQGPQERGPRSRASTEVGPLVLGLTAKGEHPTVEFKSTQLVVPGKSGKRSDFGTFVVAAARDRGRIKEASVAAKFLANGNHFRVPDLAHPAVETSVEPPSPFLGSATFRRESAHRTSWSGDLRVNLPGFGVVPLAGPGIEATMCSSLGCIPKKYRRR
jgi:hypothetical protein